MKSETNSQISETDLQDADPQGDSQGDLQSDPHNDPERMSVQGNHRLAQTLYSTLCLTPLIFIGLTWWILPQLPSIATAQKISLETPLLGVTLLSAVLCDTLFYLRLRRFRGLPNIGERARIPPLTEVKRGWLACAVAWGFVQLYVVFGVTEAILTRQLSSMSVFVGFAAITMYRCRPRHGLFAAPHWGTPLTSSPNQDQDADRASN